MEERQILPYSTPTTFSTYSHPFPFLPKHLRMVIHFKGRKFMVVLPIESTVYDCKVEILRVYKAISGSSDTESVSELCDSNKCTLFDGYEIGMLLTDLSELFASTDKQTSQSITGCSQSITRSPKSSTDRRSTDCDHHFTDRHSTDHHSTDHHSTDRHSPHSLESDEEGERGERPKDSSLNSTTLISPSENSTTQVSSSCIKLSSSASDNDETSSCARASPRLPVYESGGHTPLPNIPVVSRKGRKSVLRASVVDESESCSTEAGTCTPVPNVSVVSHKSLLSVSESGSCSIETDPLSSDDMDEAGNSSADQTSSLQLLMDASTKGRPSKKKKKLSTSMFTPSNRKLLGQRTSSLHASLHVNTSRPQHKKRKKLSLSKKEASVFANITPVNISTLLDDEEMWYS